MQLSGEALIAAQRATVWAALNDPAVLARCIDGVQSLEPDGDNRFVGALDARVGPVKARFNGAVTLTEIDAPNRYVLVGEGKGGVAGFAKGSADVTLHDTDGGGTRLTWAVNAQVGGKLAQLGARLVEGAARGYADSFFRNFKAIVEAPAPEPPRAEPAPAEPAPGQAARATPAAAASGDAPVRGIPPWIWAGLLVLAILLVLVLLLRG
ncbi:CoxG family protein [Thermaurantiacus sp.]